MVYHVLNGDALAYDFPIDNFTGEIISMREALIDGDLSGNSLPEFWKTRAAYMNVPLEQYQERVVTQLEKITSAPPNSTFNLWFGYDLFCQVNTWFILSLLDELPGEKEIYMVYPSYLPAKDIWKDFGNSTSKDLETAWVNKVRFNPEDISLGHALWQAYKNNDLARLEELSHTHSPCFPYLETVCKAHLDRFSHNGKKPRPEAVIEDIIQNGTTGFHSVFQQFFEREGVYGFGDDQLKKIYDRVIK
jgi:hypothetical protein